MSITDQQQQPSRLAQSLRGRPERVLLATDGGLAGIAAVRWLADRATIRPLTVHIVEVVGDPASGGPDESEADSSAEQARDLLLHEAPHTIVRCTVADGDPLEVLRAEAADVDLVVVGTNRAPRLLPHPTVSFATRLAGVCPCPVAVVPRGWEPSDGPVVVGVQGDGSDAAALEFAADEAERRGKQLVLLHAWGILAAAEPGSHGSPRSERVAEERMSATVERMRAMRPHVRIAPLLDHDDPVHALVRAGRGSALVVVGAHRSATADRPLMRSISAWVLDRPTCPMVVVADPVR